MPAFLLSLLEILLLVTALSSDAFVSSFAYGTNRIRIPFVSMLVINVICSVILGVALLAGAVIEPLLPTHLTHVISFAILLVLGVIKLFDSSLKAFIKRHTGLRKKISFSLFSLHFILNIYADPEQADQDHSRVLSPMEAVSLAVALSIDGIAVGFGAGLGDLNLAGVLGLSFGIGMLAVALGCALGNKIAEKTDLNLSWMGGALLIVLALLKLR